MPQREAGKGIYLLEVTVAQDQRIAIGARGRIAFARGTYVYVGSAQHGLAARIARHRRKRKRRHWHIDYLLAARRVKVESALCTVGGRNQECETARRLAAAARPIPGFGSSDCRCVSHLFQVTGLGPVLQQLEGWSWRAI